MRVVFMGTPDFASAILSRLIDEKVDVCGVFTMEDKPRGRHMVLTPPPVKVCAEKHGIPVFQPKSLKHGEAMPVLEQWKPDVIIVAAYGMILKPDVLHFPKYGCINVHASLLPKYRGAAPINKVILDGETETGVTTMQMNEGLDTGDMLVSRSTPIGENETAGELFDRLSILGGDVLMETLQKLEAGTLKPVPQDDSQMSYAPMLSKKDSPIDWDRSAQDIHNQIRGLNPWPTALAVYQGKNFKIHRSILTGSRREDLNPGALYATKDKLYVVCGDHKVLELTEVQPLGSRKMASADFLRGHTIEKGASFDTQKD